MKKNKNNDMNAFNIFIEDLSNKYRRKISFHQAQEEWVSLTEVEKTDYHEKAREKKLKMGLKIGSQQSNPVINNFERKRKEMLELEAFKATTVKTHIENCDNLGVLDDKVFYIISAETFYEDSYDVYPCEFAMAKFSLKKGIFDTLQIRINPGLLPLGAAYTAREKAKLKHRYPVPESPTFDPNIEERSYILILKKIITFMDPFDEIPMFFAEGHQSDTESHDRLFITQRVLKKIFREACEYQIASELNIYSISELLFYLRSVLSRSLKLFPGSPQVFPFENVEIAHKTFAREEKIYEFSTKGCDYHDEMDCIQNCCLSKVRRYCYIVIYYCINSNKHSLKEVFHYPKGFKSN